MQVSLLTHDLFSDEPFTEREAWLWMIANAAWKETKHKVGNALYPVPVGSFFCTYRQLKEAWKWTSTRRVHAFFTMLKSETMIETQSETGKTLVSICNYDKYQVVYSEHETGFETQSETDLKHKRHHNTKIDNSLQSLSCPEPMNSHLVSTEKKIAIWLSASGGKSVGISFDEARNWQRDFPGVDVVQQLRSMRAWLDANPTRRKTERGMRRFVVSWLSKSQDRGGSFGRGRDGRKSVGDSFVDLARDMGILNDGKRDHQPAGLFDAGDTRGNGSVLDLAVTPSEPEDGSHDDFTRRLLHRP